MPYLFHCAINLVLSICVLIYEILIIFLGFTEVAGCSAEFVNNVLKNVDLGDKTGGLDIEIRDD